MNENIENEIIELRKRINDADLAYYVKSSPIISDSEYDKLFNRLLELEEKFPDYKTPDSPTQRIGSDIDNSLPESEHSIPVLSLDKCYTIPSVFDWYKKNVTKLNKDIEIIIEPKIDGSGVVLYYDNGFLKKALTRGNGYIGNDITENIKTIRTVPLKIDYKKRLAVRSEVYINKNDFKKFNEEYAEGIYSNPRNLASGAIRRLKSKESALFPLNIFCYEGYFEENDFNKHIDNLIFLKELGFPLNNHLGYFSENITDIRIPFDNSEKGKIEDISKYIENFSLLRKKLEYEIDGLVLKINDIRSREILGMTQHHPRWAIAYKFDAPLSKTKVISIDIQIGRAGRVTPVANLEPVELAGSVISRATLHNMDYIEALGINSGDTVTISKRGDVIPAVEEVIEKGENNTFRFPENCPECDTKLIKDGAHHFCPNSECPKRLLGTLQYFVSRNQMDIETLGDKTLDFLFNKGFVKYIYDIYEFDYNKLIEYEGFKEKKIQNIIDSVNESKKKDFKTVLSSLGLKDIGNKLSEILVTHFKDIDKIIKICSEKDIFGNNNSHFFSSINGIGEKSSESIIKHFNNPQTLKLIERLKKNGLNFKDIENKKNNDKKEMFLNNTKWVITGSFENFKPRDKAADIIKEYGGEVLDAISGKINYLLCGESPGSKLDKAKNLGVKIINEKEFLEIINQKKLIF